MTHSGSKPHAVGDRGQQYEVSYFDPAANARKVMGWTDDLEAARRMADAVQSHPSWAYVWVTDRRALTARREISGELAEPIDRAITRERKQG